MQKDKRVPFDCIETVMQDYHQLEDIKSDAYPWHGSAFDEMACGLEEMGIDTDAVWANSEAYAKRLYGRGFIACAIELGSSSAVTNLIEFYALLKYNNLEKLREISMNPRLLSVDQCLD